MEPSDLISARRHQEELQQSMDALKPPPMCSGAFEPEPTQEPKPVYHGMCTCVGNPVFSNMPVRNKPAVRDHVDQMSRPFQHPMYQTTSGSTYGHRPPNHGNVPIAYFPRETKFTAGQLNRNYEDSHFTTASDTVYTGL